MASRGSSAWRTAVWGNGCGIKPVAVPIYAGGPKVQVRETLRDSVIQLGAVFLRHGYVIQTIGGYNCRAITGGTSYSAHAYGLAIDVNEQRNPYRLDKLVTDMSAEMIADVYAIKTTAGVQVWRWGGDWDGRPDTKNSNYDAMHFECIATPAELLVGFTAYTAHPDDVVSWPVIRRGARGPAVVELQRLLGLNNTTGVGEFGPRTEAAVKVYQTRRGLTPDGVVGHGTWTALLTGMPALLVGDVGPVKPAAPAAKPTSAE